MDTQNKINNNKMNAQYMLLKDGTSSYFKIVNNMKVNNELFNSKQLSVVVIGWSGTQKQSCALWLADLEDSNELYWLKSFSQRWVAEDDKYCREWHLID